MIIHGLESSLLKKGNPLPLGVYDGLIKNTSTRYWDKNGFIPRRRRERKTWVFLGGYSKDLMIGIAVVDAGFIANAFTYFFVPSEQLFVEDKITLPGGFSNHFDPGLHDEWKLKNYLINTVGNKILASYKGKFELSVEMNDNQSGLSFICPSPSRPFNFTYKNVCLPATFSIKYNGKTYNEKGDFGSIDFSKGYPPRHTIWNWASITGTLENGQRFGANLLDGHNGKYENAAWIGEDRILLPVTKFKYSKSKPLDQQVWEMYTENKTIELTFDPVGVRKENLNAVVMKSKFTQCFGHFKGKVKKNGEWLNFEGYGPAEEHEALW